MVFAQDESCLPCRNVFILVIRSLQTQTKKLVFAHGKGCLSCRNERIYFKDEFITNIKEGNVVCLVRTYLF